MSKNQVQPVQAKSMQEMSDVEFITYADYLSNPYYRAYVDAQNFSDSDAYTRQPARVTTARSGRPAPSGKAPKGKKRVPKNGYRRRNGWLFLITLLMIVLVAGTVLGYLNIVPEFTSLFNRGGEVLVDATDPVIGIAKKFDILKDMDSTYYTEVVSEKLDGADILGKIMYFGLPVAIVVYLITAIWLIIKGIAAMAGKKICKGFVSKKRRFGIGCIVMIVMALFTLVSGFFWAYGSFDTLAANIVNFIKAPIDKVAGAGYLALAYVALPIIAWLFTAFAYKKASKIRK